MRPNRFSFLALLLTFFVASTFAQTTGFVATGSMNAPRAWHTATLLNDGRVLMIGGMNDAAGAIDTAEIYDPATGAFTTTGNLNNVRSHHVSVLLGDGSVFVAGGNDADYNVIASTEIYNPATGVFTPKSNMLTERMWPMAVLLKNGKVLIAGGQDASYNALASAELYDPDTGFFSYTGDMTTDRAYGTATLLTDGRVLITGGWDNAGDTLTSAEIYDPDAGTFTATGSMHDARFVHSSALLNGGPVLISGGFDANYNYLASAELFDPATGAFSLTGSLNDARLQHAAIPLTNGSVFVVGGIDATDITTSTELFDSTAHTFSLGDSLLHARDGDTATLLNDGTVLVAGGNFNRFSPSCSTSAEIYTPASLAPVGLISIAITPTAPAVMTGSTQQLQAVGTFSDTSTQVLTSAIWASSDSTVAAVTNDRSNRGAVLGVASGNANVTACTGTICGTASVTVQTPSVTSFWPSSGPWMTEVTINGSNFGGTPLRVTLGNVQMGIAHWTDSQIKVTVPFESSSGDIVIHVGSTSITVGTFTIGALPTVVLSPDIINMVVGETRTLDARDINGAPLAGLTWTTSDDSIVSLSTDDPPILTAKAIGQATISAGITGSATVNVYAGTVLPDGTPLWSVTLGGDGPIKFVPAVPSDSGVDVFALDGSGSTLSAISSDGAVHWRQSGLWGVRGIIPDFSGNALLLTINRYQTYDSTRGSDYVYHDTNKVTRVDPATGTLHDLYAFSDLFSGTTSDESGSYDVFDGHGEAQAVVPHPSGVLFVEDIDKVKVIDIQTGAVNATVALESSTYDPDPETTVPPLAGQMIVAGDGNAYVPYMYQHSEYTDGDFVDMITKVMLLRVSPDGSSAKTLLGQYTGTSSDFWSGYAQGFGYRKQRAFRSPLFVITNGADGVAVSSPVLDGSLLSYVKQDSLGSQVTVPLHDFAPKLQREDGSYVGLYGRVGVLDTPFGGLDAEGLVAVDSMGSALWQQAFSETLPLLSPTYATADGGITTKSVSSCIISGWTANDDCMFFFGKYKNYDPGTIYAFDTLGASSSSKPDVGARVSWKNLWYSYSTASISQLVLPPIEIGNASFSPVVNANPSENGKALQRCAPLDATSKGRIEDAYLELYNFLYYQVCPFCIANIFPQLGTSQAEFTTYLGAGHQFCNGTKSQEPGASINAPQATVAAYFAAEAADQPAAVTVRKSNPLIVFFNPSSIQPNISGFDRSLLFHEALHGLTGKADGSPFLNGLCNILPEPYKSPCLGGASSKITTWIEDNLFSNN